MALNETHNPELRSWVESASDPATDFPIQNLPYGLFRRSGSRENPRGGVAIGDQIFDLAALDIDSGPDLNRLAAAGPRAWRAPRKGISKVPGHKGHRKNLAKHPL